MREKVKVRKMRGSGWFMSMPPVGFSGRLWTPYPSHAEALAAALAEIAKRTAPQNLYANTSTEGWGPWTLKAPRL